MKEARRSAAKIAALFAASALLLAGCTTPARPDRMTGDIAPVPQSTEPPEIATVFVTVYGDDVGGFASHYYPLPRSDFEQALLNTIASDSNFAAATSQGDADYAVNVGLISLVAPQWSGNVTLETSWSITTLGEREELGRQMIRTTSPSPFSKRREATEEAARTNIVAGLEWLAERLRSLDGTDSPPDE